MDLPRFDSGDGFYDKVTEMAKKNLSKTTDPVPESVKDEFFKKDAEISQVSIFFYFNHTRIRHDNIGE